MKILKSIVCIRLYLMFASTVEKKVISREQETLGMKECLLGQGKWERRRYTLHVSIVLGFLILRANFMSLGRVVSINEDTYAV